MPKLITSQRYTQILWETCSPQRFMNPRDASVYFPSIGWFKEVFIPLLDSVTGIYEPESNDCEDISLEANVLMNRLTNKYVKDNNLPRAGNSLSVVCEIIIPSGYVLNGIRDGVHAPHTIVFDDESVFLFEAQPSIKRLTSVEEALDNGCVFRELKP